VLLGSTQKMGTGTNVQKRLVALHHLDAPWKPSEVEQREGRILRQGNENAEVAIYRYVTEGSFDAYMWQALETKARFIAQVMKGESAVRKAEDIGSQELSYAEVKAIASGNPAVLTLAEADAELQRLSSLKKHHADEQYVARRSLRELPQTIARLAKRLDALTEDLATITAQGDDPFRGAPGRDAMEVLGSRIKSLPEKVRETGHFPLGHHRGLKFGVVLYPSGSREVFLEGATTRFTPLSRESHGPRAVLNAVERLCSTYESTLDKTQEELSIAQGQLRDHEARLGGPFVHDAYLTELTSLRDQLRAALSGAAPEPEHPPAGEIGERIQILKASHSVEAAPVRESKRGIQAAEEPVTARIRRHLGVPPSEPITKLPPLPALVVPTEAGRDGRDLAPV
jgi:hypothetical protein